MLKKLLSIPTEKGHTLWRVELLVVIILIPTTIIFVLSYLHQRSAIIALAQSSAKTNLSLTASQVESTIDSSHQYLSAISQLDDLNNPSTCHAFLASQQKLFSNEYANIGVALVPSGNVVCTAVGLPDINIYDRLYYQQAVNNKTFSVGQYQIGRITKQPGLNFGYPIEDSKGNITGVIYIALNLNAVASKLKQTITQNDSVLMMIDKNGTVIAEQPEQKNSSFLNISNSKLFSAIKSQVSGSEILLGPDGVQRYYSFEALPAAGGKDVFIAAGVPMNELMQSANESLKLGLTSLAIIFVLAIVIAWSVGKLLIINYINAISSAKDSVISLVSHQLRTPATGVKTFLGILLEGYAGKLTDEQKEMVSKANESNNRQIAIINDLLYVARVDIGKITLNLKDTDLITFIKDIVSEQQGVIDGRKQKVNLTLPTACHANIDPDRLRMSIENLLTNAIKYSPDNSSIDIYLNETTQNIEIIIRDHGIGIPKDEIGKLFGKFSRIENSSTANIQGNGLGLYLAKKLVNLHGGEIVVESEFGRGSTFKIELPKVNQQ